MFEKTIEKIVELGRPVIITDENWPADGRVYSSKQIHPVLDPMPVCLKSVHTLTGLSTYLAENVDKLKKDELMIHVQTPTEVALYGMLTGPFCQRPHYLQATAQPPVFHFEKYYPVEAFIIALQALFCPTDARVDVFRIVGNLKQESSTKTKDDGVTQRVTVKMGITQVEEVEIENPVVLKPYRTFAEIDQPESNFILRIKHDPGLGTVCALFEADGGTWKLEAILRINIWIEDNIKDVAVVA